MGEFASASKVKPSFQKLEVAKIDALRGWVKKLLTGLAGKDRERIAKLFRDPNTVDRYALFFQERGL